MEQGKTTLQSKLDNCREAERNNYLAKVEYIYATMKIMLETPMQEIDPKCLSFIYDTYDRAKEMNGDE